MPSLRKLTIFVVGCIVGILSSTFLRFHVSEVSGYNNLIRSGSEDVEKEKQVQVDHSFVEDYFDSLPRFQDLSLPESVRNITHDQIIYPESHACSLFGSGMMPSAVAIWRQHISKVVPASRHRVDKAEEFVWHDFTARLLNYMTPERLQKSVKKLPFNYWNKVGSVLDLIYRRWRWINNGSPKNVPEPRRVYVMVMGGSVTLGVLCHENPVESTGRFVRRDCAWMSRLEQFIISITGKDLFRFEMFAQGGTNTASGTNMWEYSTFPSDTHLPDIIIHAYATNDMHTKTNKEAKRLNTTLEALIFQANEEFIRSVLSTSSAINRGKDRCETVPPLLLYYDDYIGNEQKNIYETQAFSRAIGTLSAYYGFGVISYADAVRDLVFSNTNETWFSPTTWPQRNIHPGMGMHISSIWIFAFNFLTMATTYCDMPTAMNLMDENVYKAIEGLPALHNNETEINQHPLPKPRVIPPKLYQNLSLDNVTKIWQEAETLKTIRAEAKNYSKCDVNGKLYMPRYCLYSWIGNGVEKDKVIKSRIKDSTFDIDHWAYSNDHSKIGFRAEQANASFSMRFSDIDHHVLTLNFMTMTSYGKDWEGSKIHVDATVIPKDTERLKNDSVSIDISGHHEKTTSEIFVHQLKLKEKAVIGDELLIHVRLIDGVTFKITGMAFCDH